MIVFDRRPRRAEHHAISGFSTQVCTASPTRLNQGSNGTQHVASAFRGASARQGKCARTRAALLTRGTRHRQNVWRCGSNRHAAGQCRAAWRTAAGSPPPAAQPVAPQPGASRAGQAPRRPGHRPIPPAARQSGQCRAMGWRACAPSAAPNGPTPPPPGKQPHIGSISSAIPAGQACNNCAAGIHSATIHTGTSPSIAAVAGPHRERSHNARLRTERSIDFPAWPNAPLRRFGPTKPA